MAEPTKSRSFPVFFFDPISSQQIRITKRSVLHLQVFKDSNSFSRISLSVQHMSEKDIMKVIAEYESKYLPSKLHAFRQWKREYHELELDLYRNFQQPNQ